MGIKSFIGNALPLRPDVGPPLPSKFFVQWPAKMVYNMPRPIVQLGNQFAKLKYKLVT